MVVALGLGANRGDPLHAFQQAKIGLGNVGRVLRQSRLYQTAPIGPAQPCYTNAVLLLETGLSGPSLLRSLLSIEAGAGRDRSREQRWNARVLDLDLLCYGNEVLDLPGLSVPHPRMHERRFVLAPLCEVWPTWRHPQHALSARELLEKLGPPAGDEVFPWRETW